MGSFFLNLTPSYNNNNNNNNSPISSETFNIPRINRKNHQRRNHYYSTNNNHTKLSHHNHHNNNNNNNTSSIKLKRMNNIYMRRACRTKKTSLRGGCAPHTIFHHSIGRNSNKNNNHNNKKFNNSHKSEQYYQLTKTIQSLSLTPLFTPHPPHNTNTYLMDLYASKENSKPAIQSEYGTHLN